uniref:Putative ovule protein n=1 Tax=Solanum chacoense TaxID=4108 RepID=A0A0V0GWA4_SOLCH
MPFSSSLFILMSSLINHKSFKVLDYVNTLNCFLFFSGLLQICPKHCKFTTLCSKIICFNKLDSAPLERQIF